MTPLAARLAQPDLADLPDWAAAERLNAPDPSLPELVELRPTLIGPAAIMAALGADDGAALLDALERLASERPPVKWAMRLIERDALDAGSLAVREQVSGLAARGAISEVQAAKLLRIGEHRRRPSWAEANGVEVTARTVGIARGARP